MTTAHFCEQLLYHMSQYLSNPHKYVNISTTKGPLTTFSVRGP